MKTPPRRIAPALMALLALAPPAPAQQGKAFSVGYVYPAGAKQGTTSEHVIAGQFLGSATNIHVSGGGVTATVVDFIHPISGKELNDLRIKMDELMARKAVAQKNFKALENFRSFKNAKDLKNDADGDAEIEALKQKYAGATWTKEDEKLVADIRKKMNSGVRRPANPAICELLVCQFTVAPDAKPGRRELRIGTQAALSNPLVFYVGDLPEFSEEASKDISEQKSSIARTSYGPKNTKAKDDLRVSIPAIVNGQILPGEMDRIRFAAKRGQKLVVSVRARDLIPYISDAVPGWFQATLSLHDATGKELAYRDDFRFDPDPVVYYEIPADGEYHIEIKDAIYRGREDFVYRITIGETPFITSIFPLGGPANAPTTVDLYGWNLPNRRLTLDGKDREPGVRLIRVRKDNHVSNQVPFAIDSLPESLDQEAGQPKSGPMRVAPPLIVNGRIERQDDIDVFSFDGKAGQQIVAEVMARRLNSPLDSTLQLVGPDGKEVAFNDDNTDRGAGLTTHHADSYLAATLPADGAYMLNLRDTQHRGGHDYSYRLRISPPMPDFALRIVPSTVSARAGATIPVTVYALRKDGFTGDIAIALKNAPEGFRLAGAKIPAGEDKVKLTLTAPPQPSAEPVTIELEGRATVGDREIAHDAVPADDRMQAFEYRHLVPSEELTVAISGRSDQKSYAPKVKVVSDTPIKIPAGGTATIRLATSGGSYQGKSKLELVDAPEGIVIKNIAPSRDGMDILIESDATKVQPGLKGNLIVSANAPAQSTSKKNKGSSSKGSYTMTLPAIPFEVTQK